MTKWYKPAEKLPENDEQVLVRQGDYITVAFFDATRKIFQLKNGAVLGLADLFTWMELLRGEGM